MDLLEAGKNSTQRHPWELARGSFFVRLLSGALPSRRAVRFLDVGCGDAWFAQRLLQELPSSARATGWDTALDEERRHRLRAAAPARLTLTSEPPLGTFDLLLCMDVLEHVEDDFGFLRSIVNKHLKPGGLLLCTVPAWQMLFSDHDRALKHFRRYSPASCSRVLKAADLHILRSGGLFHGLALIRLVQAMRLGRSSLRTGDNVGIGYWKAPPTVTRVLSNMLTLEGSLSWIAARCQLELPGLSWWALCRRLSW